MKNSDPFAAIGGPKMKSGRALLKKFKPHPENPRIHPKAEIDLLSEILKLRGPDQPIVVDDAWVILKGHGRLEAAQLGGLKDFPYVQRFGLTEAEKRAIRIEDNAVPLLAGWDKTLLATDLIRLKTDGYDMKMLGFGDTQLVAFMTTPTAPGEFAALSEETVKTEYRCPKCAHEWSGKPKP